MAIVLKALAPPPANDTPMLIDRAKAIAVDSASMLASSMALTVMLPSASSSARSTWASTVLLISLVAVDTPMATEPPNMPKEAATETAKTEESMAEVSVASTETSPSTSMPAPVVWAMKARVCEPTRLTALAPAPLSAAAICPPAAATEPEKTVESISCAVSARTDRSSVVAVSGSASTDERSIEASMRLAAGLTRCFHFFVSA